MLPFKRILFPVDFSERCAEAGVYVVAMAKHFQAELTLLHVVDAAPLEYLGMEPAITWAAADAQAMIERRREELDSFLKDQLANLPVKRIVDHGDAATIISGHAAQANTDLIMMPTHGYGSFRRFLLGSVTAKVLHDAECPVWTSAHLREGISATSAPPTEVPAKSVFLCAVDLTTESIPLIQLGAQLAHEFGGGLRLVHAIPAAHAAVEQSFRERGFPQILFDAAREAIQGLQKEAGTNAELCLEAGDVSKVVRSVALRLAADLLIIGRGRLNETLGSLRTQSYAIIRESPCPVLSIFPGRAN